MGGLSEIISEFGASAKGKLANRAVKGAPEDQLRAPLEMLVTRLAELTGLPRNAVKLVGEMTLAHLSTRPDYAVSVRDALAGFIEVKAPGTLTEMLTTHQYFLSIFVADWNRCVIQRVRPNQRVEIRHNGGWDRGDCRVDLG